jgi:hypothetical protein
MQNSHGRLKHFGDKNCLPSSFTSNIHPPVEKSNNYVMLESRDQRLPGLRRRLEFAASPGYEVVPYEGAGTHLRKPRCFSNFNRKPRTHFSFKRNRVQTEAYVVTYFAT